jgi:hypothetical protein
MRGLVSIGNRPSGLNDVPLSYSGNGYKGYDCNALAYDRNNNMQGNRNMPVEYFMRVVPPQSTPSGLVSCPGITALMSSSDGWSLAARVYATGAGDTDWTGAFAATTTTQTCKASDSAINALIASVGWQNVIFQVVVNSNTGYPRYYKPYSAAATYTSRLDNMANWCGATSETGTYFCGSSSLWDSNTAWRGLSSVGDRGLNNACGGDGFKGLANYMNYMNYTSPSENTAGVEP